MRANVTGLAGAAFLLCLASGSPAAAQSPIAEVLCAPSPALHDRLTRQFGSDRLVTGLRGPEEVMELWSSERTGRWTLVMSYANGTSCIVAMGKELTMARPGNGAG